MNFNFVVFLIALVLDSLIGDPNYKLHPIRLIGNLIGFLDKQLNSQIEGNQKFWRKVVKVKIGEKTTQTQQFFAGVNLVILVLFIVGGLAFVLQYYTLRLPFGEIALGILMSQFLASKSLLDEGNRIADVVEEGDIKLAREQIGYLVSRNTDDLNFNDVTKAAVETLTENTTDAIVAPIFYYVLFGFVGIAIYKAVNTMDSMIGYHNEQYEYFGKCAARVDDAFNFIPARIAAFLLLIASLIKRGDVKNAMNCYLKQRWLASSPNAGCTEAVMAGSLGIMLSGPTKYFGKIKKREYIGLGRKKIELDDLKQTIVYVRILALLSYCWAMAILY